MLPSHKLLPIMMKAKKRTSLAVALAQVLFDQDTRVRCNSNGRINGKPTGKLDPKIMKFIRRKCFEFQPPLDNIEDEWQECTKKINESGRDLKRRLKNKSVRN